MTGIPLIIAFFIMIVVMIVAISKFKIHPFLSIMGVSLILALLDQMGSGSLLIGALMGLGLSGGWALLCIVGFCGGFTTFSTFSLETVTLLRAGSYLPAALYMWSSMVLSIAAVCGGYYLGTKFNTFE